MTSDTEMKVITQVIKQRCIYTLVKMGGKFVPCEEQVLNVCVNFGRIMDTISFATKHDIYYIDRLGYDFFLEETAAFIAADKENGR